MSFLLKSCAVLTLVGAPAWAAPIFSVLAHAANGEGVPTPDAIVTASDTSRIERSVAFGTASAKAISDRGYLAGLAIASAVYPKIAHSTATAEFFLDDVMFTSTDPGAATAMVSLNFHLSGDFQGTLPMLDGGFLVIEVAGQGGGATIGSQAGGSPNWQGFGLLLNYTPTKTTYTTAPFSVPLNQRFVIGAELTVTASAVNNLSVRETEAVMNYLNTFSFPVSGPVFNLPEGVSVNSAAGNIVNNEWLGTGSQAVPEPSTATMALLALAVTLLHRRRLR
jgi:hypothetical protein